MVDLMGLSQRWLTRSVLFVGLGFCTSPALAQTSQPAADYDEPRQVCEISDRRLDEASGLAASRLNPGYYYTHNDSKGRPHVYVINRHGRICLVIRLTGAVNLDWEDISLAPGEKAGTFDVCVADIGDNKAARTEITFYRFPEPKLDAASRARGALNIKPRVFKCKYEDGARNAEGFAVDPLTGDGYVFTKRHDGTSHVYCLASPWNETQLTTLKRVGTLKCPEALPLAKIVTAADISPDGTMLITRSYLGGRQWRMSRADKSKKFTDIFSQTPTALVLAAEPQGEAICFSHDRKAILTISEQTPTALHEIRVRENTSSTQP